MTLNKLVKELQKLVDAGYGRRNVCVDKPTFTHNLESDGASILDISGVRTECVYMLNDDGGYFHNGKEKIRLSVVIHGDAYEPNKVQDA